MTTFSKHLFAALIGTSLLAACSRPVAYFQPSVREQYKSTPSEVAVVSTPVEVIPSTPVETVAPATPVASAEQAASTEQIAQAKQALSQVEAYVRNDSKLASNKKLAKRMNRVNELLATATPESISSVKETSTHKTNLIQRIMLKQIDKKVKNHLAPEQTMLKSMLTIGLIVGIIGLLLIILNVASPLGIIALVVGLVLVLIDLLR